MSEGDEARVISILGGPPPWMKFANCRNMRNEMFFVKRGGRPDAGIEVCKGCPVKRECRKYAEDHGITDGVWGGENFSRRSTTVTEEDP